MPKRIPVQTVIVNRDGKQIAAPIGKPFDFTNEELADIKAVNPDAVRIAVNEDPEPEAQNLPVAAAAEPVAADVAAKADSAGKKPNTGSKNASASDL